MVLWVKRFVVSFVLAGGALSAAAGGASAAGWLPPVNVATGDYGSAVDVGVDAQGTAVAVWRRHITGLTWSAVAATRPVGGQWSAPVDISSTDRTVTIPKVAVDPDGNAVAIWAGRGDEPGTVIWATSRPAAGAWSEPIAISNGDGEFGHEITIDGNGNATAIWCEISHDDEEVGYYVRTASRPLGGEWSAPVTLSGPSALGQDPQLAVAPDGDATAVWTLQDSGGGGEVVQTASRPAEGDWSSTATTLSSDERGADGPVVAIDPLGNATAAWSLSSTAEWTPDSVYTVQAAHRAAGGEWSEPVEVSADAVEEVFPQVALAVDPQGDTTAVWSSFEPDGYVLRSSSRVAEGAWSTPVIASAAVGSDDPWEAGNPRVVVDPHGNATAIWKVAAGSTSPSFGNYRLQAAHRSNGGAWSTPAELPGDDLGSAAVAVDPHGYVTTIWSEGRLFSDTRLRSSVFDPVAPELHALAVPASGVVGQPVAMSVDPFDLWSPVTTRWDFGDRRSGSGATIDHCYSSPGERMVTITGTDPAANAASASRTITIEPNPALPRGSDPCPEPGPGPGPGPDPGPGQGPGSGPGTGRGPGSTPGPGPEPGPGPIAAPVVSGLHQSSSRWRTRAVNRKPRLPIGTTFRFRLNRAAHVRLAFSQIASGRRAGAHCAKPTKANRTKPHCSRYQTRGTLTITGRAGNNAYTFRGKIHGRTLEPGRYRLRLTALADGKPSAAATIGFTIAR